MVLLDLPLVARLTLLLVILALVAGTERLVRGRRATRGREYTLLVAAGALGAAFGASFDQLSVSVSPEYFVWGKGLAPGAGLRSRVAALGAEAGCGAGLLAGGVLLIAGGPRVTPARFLRGSLTVLCVALVGALVGALLQPDGFLGGIHDITAVEPELARGLARASGMHVGAYAGGALGLALAAARARGRRNTDDP